MAIADQKKNIVILGAGFAGLSAAALLGKRLRRLKLLDQYRILLVDKHQYHTYTPLLYEVATSHEEAANRVDLKKIVAFSVAQVVSKLPVEFVQTEITAIDTAHSQLTTSTGTLIAYDYLLAAPGSETAFFDIPGLRQHAHTLKSLTDALHLRKELLLSLADPEITRPRFVIGGGGVTGVELAGEIASWVASLGKKAEITIVEGSGSVLSRLDSRIIALATKRLESLGVTLRCGERICEVTESEVSCVSGLKMRYDVLMWTGGIIPSSLVAAAHVARDPEKHRVVVDKTLRVTVPDAPMAAPVFFAGDAACYVDAAGTPVPLVARAAIDQARLAANNIVSLITGTTALRGFKPWEYPYLIPIGGKYTIAKIGPLVLSGGLAWSLKLLVELRYLHSILPAVKATHIWSCGVLLCMRNRRLG